jgi:hypothetical protein
MDVTESNISLYDWYYLNSFMVNTVGGNTFIVDGQQRLTTLTLLIISLHNLSKSFNIKDGIRHFLSKNVCGYTPSGEEDFWMGFEDRKTALKNVFEYGVDGKNKQEGTKNVSEKNVYDAFDTIHSYLLTKISDAHNFEACLLRLQLMMLKMLLWHLKLSTIGVFH